MKTKNHELLIAPVLCILAAIYCIFIDQWQSMKWFSIAAAISLFCWFGIQLTYWIEAKAIAKINKRCEEEIKRIYEQFYERYK